MRTPSPRSKVIVILALALVLSLLLLTSLAHGQLSNSLQVSYIDVGQGDSIWLHALPGLYERVSRGGVRLQLRQQLGGLEQQRRLCVPAG